MDNFAYTIHSMCLASATVPQLHILDTITQPPKPHTLAVYKSLMALARHRILMSDIFILGFQLGYLRRNMMDEVEPVSTPCLTQDSFYTILSFIAPATFGRDLEEKP
ncbi:hypothetical protein BDB00DRAFT_934513 [Zychaea mexicana]|uniref:uncharacterized protein n=1 Tax=Zychaea mexicana TaxID=64656 RepID=UPI0022FF2C7E|nr:uncharacterized protein BDB00DRAFT_934513 [Zychaea mexicana]KAI9468667.1 hypothetical protein BDB00DRAFT_934513 [Zychaea mexicana]